MAEKATRNSWPSWKYLEPIPETKVRLEINRTFSQKEYEFLQQGFIPQDQDDKWFAYCEDGWLIIHRNGSGLWAFQVRLEPADEGWKITEAWAAPQRPERLLLHLLDCLASNTRPPYDPFHKFG